LDYLGHSREALEELRRIVPLQTEAHGVADNSTLIMYALEVEVLRNLKRHEEALTVLDEVLPIYREKYGFSLSPIRRMEELAIAINIDLKRHDHALETLEDYIERVTKGSPDNFEENFSELIQYRELIEKEKGDERES